MSKLLIHTCCAPCLTYIYEDVVKLKELYNYTDENVTIFWNNPNIQPKMEYNKRLECLKDFCNMKNCNLVIKDEYDLNKFLINSLNLNGFNSRCEYCYYTRLLETFKYAKENNYDKVMTTLSISPYQNQEILKSIGEKLSLEYDIEYVHLDYTSKFRLGQSMAKDLGLYRQKYCGCIFSIDNGKWEY
jgi:epoxyqueuosine reductase